MTICVWINLKQKIKQKNKTKTKTNKQQNKPETLQCTAVINTKTGNCYGRTLYIYHGLLDNKGHLLTGNFFIGQPCLFIMDYWVIKDIYLLD